MYISEELLFPLWLTSLPFSLGALHIFLFISFSLRRNTSLRLPPLVCSPLKPLLCNFCCKLPSIGLSGGLFGLPLLFPMESLNPLTLPHPLQPPACSNSRSYVRIWYSLLSPNNAKCMGKLWFYMLSFMCFLSFLKRIYGHSGSCSILQWARVLQGSSSPLKSRYGGSSGSKNEGSLTWRET